MKKSVIFATLMLSGSLLSACASGVQKITSSPSGALVQMAGFGECETPCTVKIDGPRDITVAKAGYNPKRLRIQPGGDINVDLDLAAPTEDVDAVTLPDLD